MDKPSKANWFMLFFMIYSAFMPVVLAITLGKMFRNFYINWWLVLGHPLTFGIPMLLYCAVTKTHIRDIVPHKRLSFLSVVLLLVISLLTMPVMGCAAVITSFFAENRTGELIDYYAQRFSLAYMLTAIGVMPAVFEELTFRGFIMSGYRRCGAFKAIFFSALLFGMMHLDLYQLVYAVLAGIVMGYVVYITNSIFSSMLMHFIVNGTQVAALKLLPHDDAVAQTAAGTLEDKMLMLNFAATTLAVTVPLLLLALYGLAHVNRGNEVEYKYDLSAKHGFESCLAPQKQRIVDLPFLLVIAFYVCYMLME